jgi:hypothetical protein
MLVGIGIFSAMLWEPHLEGRNAQATLVEIYFKDPFLMYAYLGSVPFFIALYQVFKALGFVREDKTFSTETLKSLKMIKYCALLTVAAIISADAYLMITASAEDDPVGAVALGIIASFMLVVLASAAAVFERKIINRKLC